jgi:HPt (histidine-containing phosphotransfer) domain-containing protein
MYTTLMINWDQLSLVVGDDGSPGDEEMKDLFRLFVEDASQRLRVLCAPGKSADRVFVAKEAHKIRGAASSFGFEQVATLLRTVESDIGELPLERLEGMLQEALSIFQQSVVEVHGRYPALSA